MRWVDHVFSASLCSFRQICGEWVNRISPYIFSGPGTERRVADMKTTLEKAVTHYWLLHDVGNLCTQD
jgi:hypothetical protein